MSQKEKKSKCCPGVECLIVHELVHISPGINSEGKADACERNCCNGIRPIEEEYKDEICCDKHDHHMYHFIFFLFSQCII